MIKDAMEFLLQNFEAVQVANDKVYVNQNYRRQKEPLADIVRVNSLDGIIDFVETISEEISEKLFLHIENYKTVHLVGTLDEDNQRNIYCQAISLYDRKKYNSWFDLERFIINLKSGFVQDANTELLLKTVSRIDLTDSASLKDDGVSQEVSVKSGVHLVDKEILPSIIKLRPYCTFTEIEQPECEFVFRVKKSNISPEIGLFECENANWQINAVNQIYDYLTGNTKIPVIR